MRRAALLTLSGLAVLFCAGVVAQVFLAGLGLLVDPSYLAWHATFVHLLEGVLLLMLVVGVVSRAGVVALASTVGLFVLIGAQYALIHGLSGPFRALHAVNAFALFALAWLIAKVAARRGWSPASQVPAARNARVDAILATAVVLVALASVGIAGALSGERADVIGGDLSADNGALSAEGPAAVSPEPDSAMGSEVYARHCSGCHGANGEGRVGPRLVGNRALADRSFVVRRVTEGEGIMPPFERSLSAEQIGAVADHVRSSWGNDY